MIRAFAGVALGVALLVAGGVVSTPNGDLTLEQIHVVFRHGNRTPQKPYPMDPNKGYEWYPMGWDQLSIPGMDSTYRLGQYVRQKYGDFLGDVYTLNDVNATSTSSPRAKQCLQLFMAGLFPPKDLQKWGPTGGVGQLWQPFIYHYMPEHLDNMFYMKNPCPAYDNEYKEIRQKSEFTRNKLGSDPEMVKVVTEKGGIERTIGEFEFFHCTVSIETYHNLTVPDWVKPFYPDRLKKLGLYHFHERALTRSMQRLLAGPLLKFIMEQVHGAKQGNKMPKTFIYSGHDDNVSALGMAIKIWGDIYPDFNSMLILELLQNRATGERFVEVKLRESHAVELHTMTVEGCDSPCSLEKFEKIVKDVIPEDWDAECQLRNGASLDGGTVSRAIVIASTLLQLVRRRL